MSVESLCECFDEIDDVVVNRWMDVWKTFSDILIAMCFVLAGLNILDLIGVNSKRSLLI